MDQRSSILSRKSSARLHLGMSLDPVLDQADLLCAVDRVLGFGALFESDRVGFEIDEGECGGVAFDLMGDGAEGIEVAGLLSFEKLCDVFTAASDVAGLHLGCDIWFHRHDLSYIETPQCSRRGRSLAGSTVSNRILSSLDT